MQLKRVSCFTLVETFQLNGGSLSLKTPQPKCGGVCLREAEVDIVLTSHVIPNENIVHVQLYNININDNNSWLSQVMFISTVKKKKKKVW